MIPSDVKDILITIIASGAFFSFIQFIITRIDNKHGIEKKIDKVAEALAEHKAVLARTHILRFADELRIGTHSKEYFLQQLQDIKTYDLYCKEHPDFENNLTKMSSEFIQEEYKRLYLHKDGTD